MGSREESSGFLRAVPVAKWGASDSLAVGHLASHGGHVAASVAPNRAFVLECHVVLGYPESGKGRLEAMHVLLPRA